MTYEVEPNLQRLIEAHPALFRGRAPAVPSYVTPGWYALIDQLCSDIEAALRPEGCTTFEVRQVKEKFGVLRIYYRLGERADVHVDLMSSTGLWHLVGRPPKTDDGVNAIEARVRELVDAACAASKTTCESCGAPAQLRDIRGYITVQCAQHYADTVARRVETPAFLTELPPDAPLPTRVTLPRR